MTLLGCFGTRFPEDQKPATGVRRVLLLQIDVEAVGAGLAALYFLSLESHHVSSQADDTPVQIVQAACVLARPLVEHSSDEQNSIVLVKAFQLLQLAGQLAHNTWNISCNATVSTSPQGTAHLQPSISHKEPTAGCDQNASTSMPESGLNSQPSDGCRASNRVVPSAVQQPSAVPVDVEVLLPHLRPTLLMLATAMVHSKDAAVRTNATRALNDILTGLDPPTRYLCLQSLLVSEHPEVCAIILQRLRTDIEREFQQPSQGMQTVHTLWFGMYLQLLRYCVTAFGAC